MTSDYKSTELNLYSNDKKLKYTFSDGTGLVPGLAPVSPILKLESDISPDGYKGSIAIPNLLYKVQNSEYYSFLSYTIYSLENADTKMASDLATETKDRKAADAVLTSGLSVETKARIDADGIHTASIAQEVYDRGAGDLANLTLINNEVADRKAAVLVVSNSAAANALAITTETNRAMAKEALLDVADADEKARAMAKEALLDAADAKEVVDRKAADDVLTNALNAEIARALDKEAKLDARIDFITSNTNPAAIDSLSEIVAQFSTNGQGYADRLTYLEGVVAALVNK